MINTLALSISLEIHPASSEVLVLIFRGIIIVLKSLTFVHSTPVKFKLISSSILVTRTVVVIVKVRLKFHLKSIVSSECILLEALLLLLLLICISFVLVVSIFILVHVLFVYLKSPSLADSTSSNVVLIRTIEIVSPLVVVLVWVVLLLLILVMMLLLLLLLLLALLLLLLLLLLLMLIIFILIFRLLLMLSVFIVFKIKFISIHLIRVRVCLIIPLITTIIPSHLVVRVSLLIRWFILITPVCVLCGVDVGVAIVIRIFPYKLVVLRLWILIKIWLFPAISTITAAIFIITPRIFILRHNLLTNIRLCDCYLLLNDFILNISPFLLNYLHLSKVILIPSHFDIIILAQARETIFLIS